MRNFRNFEVWQQSMDVATKVYQFTNLFPNSERYSLTKQIQRAAVSIPSNIAEGCGKKSNKDFARFLQIALGSAFEVETQIILSQKIGYVSSEQAQPLVAELNIIQRKVNSLISKIKTFVD